MAATIAKATGWDTSRVKTTHRLGSQSSIGEANTWRTFSKVTINSDGSGSFVLERDGEIIKRHTWGPE